MWWRHVDGTVFHEEGFCEPDAPDTWFFQIDLDNPNEEPLCDHDDRMVHEDDLFETESACRRAAIEHLTDMQVIVKAKLEKLTR